MISEHESDPYEYKGISIYWWEAAHKEKIIFDENGPYVLISKEQYNHLEDTYEKFWAVMDTISCDFKDMFPEWGQG